MLKRGIPSTAKASGLGVTKTSSSGGKPKIYEPDFSITQTTYTYQVPKNPADVSFDESTVSASPISLLFEYTGVRTSTNYELNRKIYQEFQQYPTTNYPILQKQYSKAFRSYKIITDDVVQKLKQSIEKPKNVKMTTRDFIDDSLYNPVYGYFNENVEIFHTNKPFPYNSLASTDDFLDEWTKLYEKYNEANDGKPLQKRKNTQLWHTPTELFQPYYGEAVANYIVKNHQVKCVDEKLIIYEIGAGNGTLMLNILDYIERHYPSIYENMEYRIIEISSKLFKKQRTRLLPHKEKIHIVNQDIFDWNTVVQQPCFFLAFEVLDNLAHDSIKYHVGNKQPYQGYVAIDKNNEFKEFFTPELDPLAEEYLELKKETQYYQNKIKSVSTYNKIFGGQDIIDPTFEPYWINKLRNYLWPFRNKLLVNSEFIPTKSLKLFKILKEYFPNHHLVATDFDKLPNSIFHSYNGPVVQTMFHKTKSGRTIQKKVQKDDEVGKKKTDEKKSEKEELLEKKKNTYQLSHIPRDKMVTTTTYMVNQGYFDIMFPTNFALQSEIYSLVTGKSCTFQLHSDFLKKHSDNIELTTCQNGENPMLEFYTNVAFMHSTD